MLDPKFGIFIEKAHLTINIYGKKAKVQVGDLVFFLGFQIHFNGFSNVLQQFLDGFPLRKTTGQFWHFSNKVAIFPFLNQNLKFFSHDSCQISFPSNRIKNNQISTIQEGTGHKKRPSKPF